MLGMYPWWNPTTSIAEAQRRSLKRQKEPRKERKNRKRKMEKLYRNGYNKKIGIKRKMNRINQYIIGINQKRKNKINKIRRNNLKIRK